MTARFRGVPFPPAAPSTHLDGGRNAWGRWEEHRGIPIRYLKELATEGIGFGAVLPGELWRDLKTYTA